MRHELVIAFAGMTLATYLTRSLFTVLVAKVRISPFWERVLSHVPLAVLTAFVVPYLFASTGEGTSALSPYLLAGAATLFLSYRTRNILLSAASGIVLFMILVRLFPL
ncbi:MAG TPA: AzlD domain-containing protein [Proteobacteria bacterium]|nr:branched-chain amino acid transport protein [bacterium BMS3Abin14]HDL52710.1 AzlD domain-containing protein [Pseudomonadota bacterium]